MIMETKVKEVTFERLKSLILFDEANRSDIDDYMYLTFIVFGTFEDGEFPPFYEMGKIYLKVNIDRYLDYKEQENEELKGRLFEDVSDRILEENELIIDFFKDMIIKAVEEEGYYKIIDK